ncbi:hypothetical protein S245_026205 [Arachis hypogaea]
MWKIQVGMNLKMMCMRLLMHQLFSQATQIPNLLQPTKLLMKVRQSSEEVFVNDECYSAWVLSSCSSAFQAPLLLPHPAVLFIRSARFGEHPQRNDAKSRLASSCRPLVFGTTPSSMVPLLLRRFVLL